MAVPAPLAPRVSTRTAAAAPPAPGAETRHAARDAGLLAAVGFVTGGSNFVFNVMVARNGGVSSYGGIAALLSMVTIAGFVASGVQYAMARRAATWDGPPRALLAASLGLMWPWLAVVVALFASVPALSAYLGVPDAATVLVVTQFVALLAAAMPGGVLIGRRRFALIAGLSVIGVALRLCGGALLARVMDATTAALVASFVPALLSVAVFLSIALRMGSVAAEAGAVDASAEDMSAGFATESATGAISSAALWSLWAMPLIFARHLLDAGSSGRFAAAQVLASGVLFVTAPVAMAFYPTIARHRQRRTVVVGAVATLGLAGVASLGMAVLGPWLMRHVYGPHFVVGARALLEFGASAATVSLATYAVWTARALRRRIAPVSVMVGLAAAAELLVGVAAPGGLETLAVLPCLTLATAGGALLLAAVSRSRGRSRATPAVVVLVGDEA